MARPTKTEAIKNYLNICTHADLASLYNPNMEVQVNVGRDGGTRIDGDYKGKNWHGWTDGIQMWKPIRIPWKAKTEPEYTDSEMTYDLAEHAEGIGMTGWDWKERLSRWVAFDFDALIGHSEKHNKKLTPEQLLELIEIVKQIPWVTLRRSTSGAGLHVYVFLEPITTANHTEHAALARAIIGKMAAITGFDFASKVDVCGGNMWVWHRKMRGTDGLTLIQAGSQLDEIPANWRDHMRVVTGQKTKAVPNFIEERNLDVFEQLTGQRVRIPLEEPHKQLITWLYERYPGSSWWDGDHWMLVTHTTLLKEAHEELSFRGLFDTIAAGREKGNDHNAFCFPMRNGAWSVRRYTEGVAEHSSWTQDGVGYTRCFYNRMPDLNTACRVYEGIQDPAGGYIFTSAEQAQKAALQLGVDLNLPTFILGRKAKLKEHKTGQLVVEIKQDDEGTQAMPTWISSKSKWTKMFQPKMSEPKEPEIVLYDDQVRHLLSATAEDVGWVINTEGSWHTENLNHVRAYLASQGHDTKETNTIVGSSIARSWTLINSPFDTEYPKDRQWNRDAAQLKYKPIQEDKLEYPHWLQLLQHCGSGLDDAIKEHEWCKENHIFTGADYLKCWVSFMFKMPYEPLPYLFFYGPQGSGKSAFHEALMLLMTCGVARADNALINQAGFNGELEHAVLCVVEETDLRRNMTAYNRIKDWVTSTMLPIHRKQRQPYMVRNSTHWVQTANNHLACPVFSGDTRITMTHVPELTTEIPRREFYPALEREAQHFITEILRLELPRSLERLGLPAIVTEAKTQAQYANMSFLEMFIAEKVHFRDGCQIKYSDFYDHFLAWVDPNFISQWPKTRIGRELPPEIVKGRDRMTNQIWLCNISWEPGPAVAPKWIVKAGVLYQLKKTPDPIQLKKDGEV